MIKIEDVTTGEVEGRGLYDELMRTSKAHLEHEFSEARITGSDYATVYLGMLTANLSTATNFVLQYELNNIELEVRQEALKNTIKEGLLLDAQLAQLNAQTALLEDELVSLRPKQAIQLENQNTLLTTQNAGQLEQTRLVTEQILGQTAQNQVTGKQEDLIDEQIKTEATNTVDATGGLAKANLDKSEAEVSILSQKKITEEAQTVGTVGSVGGLVGSEMALKNEQKESFIRDAEQKTAKFYADILSIAYSTAPEDAANAPDLWGFGRVESVKVTNKLLDGIGVV